MIAAAARSTRVARQQPEAAVLVRSQRIRDVGDPQARAERVRLSLLGRLASSSMATAARILPGLLTPSPGAAASDRHYPGVSPLREHPPE
jgi:hypothetical protein